MTFDDFKSRLKSKFYYKQWTLGFFYGDIKEIIRKKDLDYDIKWLKPESKDRVYADPFPLNGNNGPHKILYEDFSENARYGNISLMTIDKNLKKTGQKILLDTKSHLSFPFIFREDGKIFIFPESAHSGKLLCYEYNPDNQEFKFVKEIFNFPIYDSAIIKNGAKYWLFGITRENKNYLLNIFFSETLLGPYIPHPGNPVKKGLNGTRAAGNFIEVDNVIYRPTQNCENGYGESITINKITTLNEKEFNEEPYMTISAGKRLLKDGIHSIHTLNSSNNLIAVDGIKWTFSLKTGVDGILETLRK